MEKEKENFLTKMFNKLDKKLEDKAKSKKCCCCCDEKKDKEC